MSNGIVRRISQRKRTELRFDGHHTQLTELMRVVEGHQHALEFYRKVMLKLEIDTEAMGSVLVDVIEALPWWRRRDFGPEYLKRMRDAVVERKQHQVACESIAGMLRNLGDCVRAQKVKGNGEAPAVT